MAKWIAADMLDQSGRVIIVTGANSGLGKESARALAAKGAHVIMAARNQKSNEEARADILRTVPNAQLELARLDLGDLASIHDFATRFKAAHPRLDILMNNAGLMAVPFSKTTDGFEMQFGVNHLGHFALTGLLLERLLPNTGSRVVSLGSSATLLGSLNFEDLQSDKGYSRYGAYAQSKYANFVFAYELDKRLKAAGAHTMSNAAQPGFIYTNLQNRAATESGVGAEAVVYKILSRVLAQPIEMGVLPQLYAATAMNARGGAFYSPDTFYVFGYPGEIRAPKSAYDPAIGARLWEVSEQLTGVHYAFGDAVPV